MKKCPLCNSFMHALIGRYECSNDKCKHVIELEMLKGREI